MNIKVENWLSTEAKTLAYVFFEKVTCLGAIS